MHSRTYFSWLGLAGLAIWLLQPVQAYGQQRDDQCVLSEAEAPNKAAVEHGLLRKVHFSGEQAPNRTIDQRMTELHVPGLSLALIKGGKIAWSAGYGVQVAGDDAGVTCDTLFQAASLSKPVTLVAIMRMHEAGLIDLDVDIQSYLKEYVLPAGGHGADNPVTFRNILSHTSGLAAGGYLGYAQGEGFPTDIEVLMGTGPSNSARLEAPSEPDAQLMYSGGGYTVAEVALQDVTGESFEAVMDEWVLRPAGLRQSDFSQPLPASKHPVVARGHDSGGRPIEGGWRNHPEQAAAGLWSTAGDLAAFMLEMYKAYHGHSDVLEKETVRSMIADRRDGHVYGFRIEGEGPSLSIRHYGGNIGYRSFMMIHLETGDGAAYLTSSDSGGALGDELLLGAAKIYGWPGFQQIEKTRVQRTDEELREFVGVYAFNQGLRVSIDYRDSEQAIGIIFPNGDRYSLTPILGDQAFIHPETGVEVSFGTRKDSRTLSVYGDTAVQVE